MFRNIILDFDKTIIAVEVLEFLVEQTITEDKNKARKLEKIRAITSSGMNGEISFRESLNSRIRLLSLKESDLPHVIKLLRSMVSKSFIDNLKFLNRYNLHVVSGGFEEILLPILGSLGLDRLSIHANRLLFKNNHLVGVDQNSPLCRDLGKVEIVRSLKLEGGTVVVGDGYTDFEIKAYGLAERFVYYAEFIERPQVISKADYVVRDFDDLAQFLSQQSSA